MPVSLIEDRCDPLARLFEAHRVIRERAFERLPLAQLARQAGMSRFHFVRLFRTTFRQTPHQLVVASRLAQARVLLAETDLPITQICFECGYESLGSFSARFRRETGCSPRDYRAAQRRRLWPVGISFLQTFAPFCLLEGFRGGGAE